VSEDEEAHVVDKPRSEEKRRREFSSGFATLRDFVLFLVGLAVIANEVFFQGKVEPASMAVGLAMTGLPLVFSADERRKDKDAK
jgi:hypothetical protein